MTTPDSQRVLNSMELTAMAAQRDESGPIHACATASLNLLADYYGAPEHRTQ